MRELFRTLPLMCAVLLVPVLPFLFLGGRFEDWLQSLADDPPSTLATTGVVVGLLATDILLPVPSSVISTLAGWQLGWWLGTLAIWVGMNLGAAIGFALARRWGRPLALWFSKQEDLERMRHVAAERQPTNSVSLLGEPRALARGLYARK